MKKILIIEDDDFKAQSLRDVFSTQSHDYHVTHVGALSEAISEINENEYFLILVDMAIPSHPSKVGGGSPISLLTGGIDILLELQYLGRSDPCIVVTQYPDIEISQGFYGLDEAPAVLNSELGCSVLACIKYDDENNEWEKQLSEILIKL
ncbi:response regulator [Vibrio kanaloae]|uniref:response regulator n=1 Tax=Vibrio kanaloae TaxID=170673 RepID=UPI0010BF2F7A|nr:response regulator [Vibrio kanaloae]TKF78416.1 response regulator [Vibrio kanaloae]